MKLFKRGKKEKTRRGMTLSKEHPGRNNAGYLTTRILRLFGPKIRSGGPVHSAIRNAKKHAVPASLPALRNLLDADWLATQRAKHPLEVHFV